MNDDVVVRTARLVMRPLTAAYLPEMLGLYSDPQVTRFLKPLDEAGHLGRLRETEHMWASRGYGRVAIHERDTGRFLGRGGLHYWAQFDEVEVGWALRADAQGRGYATEALAFLAVLLGIWFIVMGVFEIAGALVLRHAAHTSGALHA